jgi:mannitol-specific phosphotransferase system IIBC component
MILFRVSYSCIRTLKIKKKDINMRTKSIFSALLVIFLVAAFSFNAEAKDKKKTKKRTCQMEQTACQASNARAHANLTRADYESMAEKAQKVPVGNKAKATPRPTTRKGYNRQYYKTLEAMGYTKAQIRDLKRRMN